MTTPDSPLIVVKIGGEIVADGSMRRHLANNLSSLVSSGRRVVICHGAGPQTTRLQRRLGIEPNIVAGRRITSPEDLAVLTSALGEVNASLVAELTGAGIAALGTTGASGNIVEATKRPPRTVTGSNDEVIDFGEVGDISSINTGLLFDLLGLGLIPVIASLSIGPDGRLLNINADTVATAIASEMESEALLLVTSVGGVRANIHDPATTVSRLNRSIVDEMIASGTLEGGMIPKVDNAFDALAAGVSRVAIVGVGRPNNLVLAASGQGAGTQIIQPES